MMEDTKKISKIILKTINIKKKETHKKKENKVPIVEGAEEEEAIDIITQKEEIIINIQLGGNTKIKGRELKQLKLNIKKL